MTQTETKKPSFLGNLTVQIIIEMLLGAILGIYVHNNYDVAFAKEFSALLLFHYLLDYFGLIF